MTMSFTPSRFLLGGAVAAPFILSVLSAVAWAQDEPKMCLMMYMMADNDLELSLAEDLFEYFDSDAIVQPNVKTWIYWDGHGGYDYDGDGDNDHTLTLGGEPAAVPHYLTYDHSIQDILSYPLDGEQNSDSPQVLCDFIYTALDNCLSFGATEFILVFSSHGNGYQGFGGDENIGRRHLLQSNRDIQRALDCGLSSAADLPNAPKIFDVIGFDACLMQSFLTARDYSLYTKYFMASEALEPGHGWWWNISSSAANGAISMATELLNGFLTETQNVEGTHLVPKTLSIVQTDLFETFLVEFESFVTELANLLFSESDPDFFAAIRRSRASVIAFDSAADNPGSRTPSAVDIGSFLSTFDELCAPTGTLKEAHSRTFQAYDDQFYARGYGEGTKPSTGMAVWFPSKRLYSADPWGVEMEITAHIDDGETSYAWLEFVDMFLNSTSPIVSTTSSVCANTFSSDVEAKHKGQLILNPEIYLASVGIEAQSDITIQTDHVITEYGFYFDEIYRRRRLEGIKTIITKTQAPITPVGKRLEKNRLGGLRNAKSAIPPAMRRSVQANEDDYLVLYNGAMSTKYRGSKYFGFFNELIYVLVEDAAEGAVNAFVYADNFGEGAFSIPVMYFSSDIEVDSTSLPPMGSVVQDAIALGGVFAELEFSTDVITGQVVSPVSLYTAVEGGDAIFETPRSQGGSLVPIVYSEVSIGKDLAFVEFIGSLHAWNDKLLVQPIDLDTFSGLIGLDLMVFDMFASDFDKADDEIGSLDFHFFEFNITDRSLNSSYLYDDDFDYMFDGSGSQSAGKDVKSSAIGQSTSDASSSMSGLALSGLLPVTLCFLSSFAV